MFVLKLAIFGLGVGKKFLISLPYVRWSIRPGQFAYTLAPLIDIVDLYFVYLNYLPDFIIHQIKFSIFRWIHILLLNWIVGYR